MTNTTNTHPLGLTPMNVARDAYERNTGGCVLHIKRGHHDSFVVMAERNLNGLVEYVTHVANADGEAVWGHYFFDEAEAEADFASRS